MPAHYISPSAWVVVSGLQDPVNSQQLRKHFQTAHVNYVIRKLVTFSTIGTALVQFLTPADAADVLANEALLEVRELTAVFPHSGNKSGLTGWEVNFALCRFIVTLPIPPDHAEEELEEPGALQNSNRKWAEVDMDPDACLVMSGFPDDVIPYAFCSLMKHRGIKRIFLPPWMKQLVMFEEKGTALAEFSSPKAAAFLLSNKRRLLKKTGLQVRKLEALLCPKEDVTTSQRQLSQLQQQLKTTKQNLNSKEQQLETAKQNLNSKEQQLQQVETENKSLQAALRCEKKAPKISINLSRSLEQENSRLKDQAVTDKRKYKRLKEQSEADRREIKRLKRQISASLSSSYEMTCDPRGVAVIINNIRFEDMADREGAEGDTDRLQEVFENLGFTVVTFIDLDHAKMVAAMKDQGNADHSNYDCFVCCIMSHGTMGKVFSSDDVGIDICELMKPVNAKKCPSLEGKPKLFFIQACQGEKCQSKESFDGDHDTKPVPGFIYHEADFFLGLATVPGYVAWRDPDGARYVKHLAKLLKDFSPTHDLQTIMAMVCDKMNEDDTENCGGISSNHSTLRKNLIFKPK